MPDQVNDSSPALDGGADPRHGVVLVEGAVGVAGPQAERVHGRRRVAAAEEAAHEARELLGRVVVVAAGAEAEVDAGRGRPEVAPPPREHAGAHHLPRLEGRQDAVQERVGERVRGSGAPSWPSRRPWRRGGGWRIASSRWPACTSLQTRGAE